MTHPYKGLPDHQFWKRAPGLAQPELLDPMIAAPFGISRTDKIVTAGSCFAQHVARALSDAGFDHHVTEAAHPLVDEETARKHQFGVYSARYGNVYTARQLRQLLERAFGQFEPEEKVWVSPEPGTGVVDPFRPQVQPNGFTDAEELQLDRRQHLACVRRAIEDMDVFVFTIGLTEAWEDRRDGAVFPLAPGVAGGSYAPERYGFVNFGVDECRSDLFAAISLIRERNPKVRIVLTVSPVSLNATYMPRHVLVSTTWSKAVLRIVVEDAVQAFADTVYFPSFEIITSPHLRGRYIATDGREVLLEGVDHVMRVFLKHFGDGSSDAIPQPAPREERQEQGDEVRKWAEALCDEEAIDRR
ncbi:GSCFA domain-containing protein [Antarctobacter jejuensis]|uniref:GSCFA domain-containing protein n=1 Tax=Antarctobacter jejuensis TaxID=1439938 RepID=UPI003FD4ADBE